MPRQYTCRQKLDQVKETLGTKRGPMSGAKFRYLLG